MTKDAILSGGLLVDTDGTPVETRFASRTAAQWAATNPVLAPGQAAYVTDTGRFVIGDGVNAFADLAGEGLSIIDQATVTSTESLGNTNISTANPIAGTTVTVPDLNRTVWLRGACPLTTPIEPDSVKMPSLMIGAPGQTLTSAMLSISYGVVDTEDAAISTLFVEHFLTPHSPGDYQLYGSVFSLATVTMGTVAQPNAPARLTAFSIS